MNRGQIRAEVMANVGRGAPQDAPEIAPRANTWINLALKELSKLVEFPELQSSWEGNLMIGVKRYPPPDADLIQHIHSLRILDDMQSAKLDWVPYREFDEEYPFPESYENARPRIYTYHGGYMEVFPLPDKAYEIKGRISLYPRELTQDDAKPDIHNVDLAIIQYATGIGYSALQERDEATSWINPALTSLQLTRNLLVKRADAKLAFHNFTGLPSRGDEIVMDGESGRLRGF